MLSRLHSHPYPRQFWLMFAGMLISTTGASMIWPFLMIYASEKLSLPLGTVTLLMTLSSFMGLMSSFIAGPIVDRLGRKWAMAVSLLINGGGYLLLSRAETLPAFALAMAVNGTFNPIYRVGADAMLADLIPPQWRTNAYALMRMSNNVGVALGPAIGGFIASRSYGIAFYCAAAGLATYGLLVLLFARETLPQGAPEPQSEPLGGYGQVLSDRLYRAFLVAFTLNQMVAALIWVLLSAHVKRAYGISESLYGWLPTTNALMVVFFQYGVSKITQRYEPRRMMALGAFLYGLATLGIAFSTTYWAFWTCMVVMTIGELIIVPTSSTFAANLAPAHMRGRYMSLYGLTWGVSAGISPLVGGNLYEWLGARAMWLGGTLVGSLSSLLFLRMRQRIPAEVTETAAGL
ncbi:MFS transporter [Anaerolinea sp.]|uniref:MDR family MFS transporter n=1 Tax=Anaerolinea sp. TaxID=1872519 RepID=UPI002ACE485B|nr:MFS transporter [Anaerolinea sp.]